MSIETAPVTVEIDMPPLKRSGGISPGSLRSFRAYKEAKRRFPGATRFEIDHRGPKPRVTAHYGRSRSSSSSGNTQQDRLARRLAEIQHKDLQSRLREISKTL